MRDSKNPQGTELTFTKAAWSALIRSIKHGEFSL